MIDTRQILCVFCLAAFVAIAGCTGQVAEQQTTTVVTPAAPAEGSAPAVSDNALVFRINSDNASIAFTGAKVSRITKAVESHVGGFSQFEGTIEAEDEESETAQIRVTVDMTSVFSDNRLLTTTIKNKGWLEVGEYPTSRFISTSVEKTESGYMVTGDLTLHGVTKSISFPVTAEKKQDMLVGEARFTMNRLDFGIVEGEGMIQKIAGALADVRNDIVLDLLVEVKPQS